MIFFQNGSFQFTLPTVEITQFTLGFDMDYVLTGDVFLPERASVLRRLLRLAGLITVSREDIWLRLLRIDPDWDFGKAEAALRRFINN